MAAPKTLILVTGGNSGVGFELAAQLLIDPSKHILLGCRSEEKGQAAVKDLSSRGLPGQVEFCQIDVASQDSISNAAAELEKKHGRLDALVNNAAIGFGQGSPAEKMAQGFQTNATSAYLVAEAFLPLLKKATGTVRIVNVSSGAGSMSWTLDPSSPSFGMSALPYSASKAAMNMITATQARIYGAEGFKVFAYSPGFVASNLSSMNTVENGAQPTSVGAAPIVKILNGERDAEHAGFLRPEGQFSW